MLFSVLYRYEHFFLTSKLLIYRIIGNIFLPLYFIATYYLLDLNIHPLAKFGRALYIHNRGIIIGFSSIGQNAKLIGPLTIGAKDETSNLAAIISDNVTVYCGARIIGQVHIGNNSIIGANAVVVKDIPSNQVWGGVPAKLIKNNMKYS